MDKIKKFGKLIIIILIIPFSGWIIGTSSSVLIGHFLKSSELSDKKDLICLLSFNCQGRPQPQLQGDRVSSYMQHNCPSYPKINPKDIDTLRELLTLFDFPEDIYRLLAILAASIFFYKSSLYMTKIM